MSKTFTRQEFDNTVKAITDAVETRPDFPCNFRCVACGAQCEQLTCTKCGQHHGLVKPSPPWFKADELPKRWKR